MKIVKNILVPTNYSAAGQNAYQYAIMLAQKIGAAITVVHVNEYILPGAENTLTPISDLEIMRI